VGDSHSALVPVQFAVMLLPFEEHATPAAPGAKVVLVWQVPEHSPAGQLVVSEPRVETPVHVPVQLNPVGHVVLVTDSEQVPLQSG
jgi:hypothetical protein